MATPRSLRVSVGLWWALAVVLLFLLVMSLGASTAEEVQALIRNNHMNPAEAESTVRSMRIANAVLGTVLASGYMSLSVVLLKRQPCARIGLTALVLVHVIAVFASLAVLNPPGIGVVIGVLATALMWRRSNTEWLTGER